MRIHLSVLVGLTLISGLSAVTRAEDGKSPAPPAAPGAQAAPDRWATPPAPRLPASAKDFEPAAEAYPAHVKRVEGMPTATPHPLKFWEDPSAKELVDPPTAKHAFALQAEGGKPGTVFVYEYAETLPPNIEPYLSLLLWLAEDYPTTERPDQVLYVGRYAFVFSFPIADPGVEWFKAHLRKTFAIPAMTNDSTRHPIYDALGAALDAEDTEAVLTVYREHEAVAAKDSYCRMTAARACRDLGDWPAVEKHYLAALELARSVQDPLPPEQIFEALTWASYALMYQDRPAEAVDGFRAAKSYGIGNDLAGSGVWGPYNVACALTKAGRLDEAVVELREAVAANAEIVPHALEDEDLAALREREDVKKLLVVPENTEKTEGADDEMGGDDE